MSLYACRQGHAREAASVMRTLEHLPVVAIARAVVQLSFVVDRRPLRAFGRVDDGGGALDGSGARCKRRKNGTNLRRMDAPHARAAELVGRTTGSLLDGLHVAEF